MAVGDTFIIDQYSPLSHKLPLRDTAPTNLAPTWVPTDQQRRLNAYKVLAAYRHNVARHLAAGTLTEDDRDKRREYGDAELLVTRTAGGVLGDQIQITVDGADEDIPDTPELPPQPDPLPDSATDLERRIFTARTTRWTEQATAIVDQWEADWAAHPALIERQEWLRSWAEDEFLTGKIVEAEGDIVGLGDGVYVLDWSHTQQRPTVDVYDPGFYFPVLVDGERGFPSKIHLAWEFERPDHLGVTRRYVRRLTYELAPIPFVADPFTGELLVQDLGDGEQRLVLQEGDTFNDQTGLVERTYPWAELDDTGHPIPSTVTCLFTDATWQLGDLTHGTRVDDFDLDKATFAVTEDGQVARRLDKRCDFILAVHVPNTPATREHFGRSVLDVVAQLLDDLHAADTDVRMASELAAGPMVALFGGNLATSVEVEPGLVFNAGDPTGRMDVLDLTKGLKELRDGRTDLRDRLAVNAQVPAEVLGVRNNEGQAPSGISIALRFGPFRQLVDLLRLTRMPKYQLLLKMAQRLAQAGGVLEPGPNPTARLVFGSYLPSDVAEAIKQVVLLLQAHGVSRLTALRMLVDAGIDIGDLADELDRINAEDTGGALAVADATGSEQLAADRLGLELPDTAPTAVPAPTITLPGVPPAQ